MDTESIRFDLAKAIWDLRGLHSTPFLRGMARAASARLDAAETECPYARATAQMDAFWAGFREGIRHIEVLVDTIQQREKPQVHLVAPRKGQSHTAPIRPERAETPWESDEVESLIDQYCYASAALRDLAMSFSRTENAIIWMLWSKAGAKPALLEVMRDRNHTKPARGADLRNEDLAFKWVTAYLKCATEAMARRKEDVTLDALLQCASGALAAWSPHDAHGLASSIEYSAARWFFNRLDKWEGY